MSSPKLQLNLLDRLAGIDFEILAPHGEHVDPSFGGVKIKPSHHASRIDQIRRLREQAGKWYSRHGLAADPVLNRRDADSWHILAVRPATGEVIGAIRVRLYDMMDSVPSASNIMSYNDVRIADSELKGTFEQALDSYVSDQKQRCHLFHQIGGFVVSPASRGSGLAPVLAMAMNAWCKLCRTQGGCTFATIESGAAAFHMKFGASPFTSEGKILPNFFCENHKAPSKLLTTRLDNFDARLKTTLDAIQRRFLETCVVTSH